MGVVVVAATSVQRLQRREVGGGLALEAGWHGQRLREKRLRRCASALWRHVVVIVAAMMSPGSLSR